MSLIIATGSNQGPSEILLRMAKENLSKYFDLVAESKIYKSDPVDYLDQDSFLNQVLEFKLPINMGPIEALKICQKIELEMGRVKVIPKGPRNIDIDIIFWGFLQFSAPELTIPHLAWKLRSFVVLPLMELPFSNELKKIAQIPFEFNNKAIPIN